jgi:hypothetical protein
MWLAIAGIGISGSITAQDSSKTTKPKKDWSKVNLAGRANDHFLFQSGYDWWSGKPDSIQLTGFSRHFNFYVMYDMPFKSNPRMSVAGGIGVGTSSIFFDKMDIDIAGKTGSKVIIFKDASKTNHFKKYKIANTWVEIPLELRFVSDPLNSGRSFKVALGGKIGLLVDAHTKGKNYESAAGVSQYGTKYKEKEKSQKYFNSTRMAATLRIGYGPFTAYGAYQLNKLFRTGEGPEVNVCSVGLCIGGL